VRRSVRGGVGARRRERSLHVVRSVSEARSKRSQRLCVKRRRHALRLLRLRRRRRGVVAARGEQQERAAQRQAQHGGAPHLAGGVD
jgi:hypothetical protein